MERADSSSSVSSFGLRGLLRTQSRGEVSNNPHAISPQLSGQIIAIDSSHLPLSRIVYNLPRASLERKCSSDEENLNNCGTRRDSSNSTKSRSGSSGFSSTGFDIRSQKRTHGDGHEMEDRYINDKMLLKFPSVTIELLIS